MILFFILLVLIAISCVFVTAWILQKNTKISLHLENVADSFNGVHKVVHDNASKTVESSMKGATNTLCDFGIIALDMNKFYNSLNKKKEQ